MEMEVLDTKEMPNKKRTKKRDIAKLQTTWDNDDFADPGIDKQPTPAGAVQPLRIFRAWLEDWEIMVRLKQDPVNEARLLKKYGGLVWHDYVMP